MGVLPCPPPESVRRRSDHGGGEMTWRGSTVPTPRTLTGALPRFLLRGVGEAFEFAVTRCRVSGVQRRIPLVEFVDEFPAGPFGVAVAARLRPPQRLPRQSSSEQPQQHSTHQIPSGHMHGCHRGFVVGAGHPDWFWFAGVVALHRNPDRVRLRYPGGPVERWVWRELSVRPGIDRRPPDRTCRVGSPELERVPRRGRAFGRLGTVFSFTARGYLFGFRSPPVEGVITGLALVEDPPREVPPMVAVAFLHWSRHGLGSGGGAHD